MNENVCFIQIILFCEKPTFLWHVSILQFETYSWLWPAPLCLYQCQFHCLLGRDRSLPDPPSHSVGAVSHCSTAWYRLAPSALHTRQTCCLEQNTNTPGQLTPTSHLVCKHISLSAVIPVAFFQMTVGWGTPCAWQCSITFLFLSTLASVGSTTQRGGTAHKTQPHISPAYISFVQSWMLSGRIQSWQIQDFGWKRSSNTLQWQ